MPQDNSRERGSDGIGRATGETRFLTVFELVLVVLVAFGLSILHSVYPLLGEPETFGRSTYFTVRSALHVAISLAFLGYVLWRNAGSGSIAAASWDAQHNYAKWGLAFARDLVSAIRRMRFHEWALVLMVAFWESASDSIHYWLRSVDYAAGSSGMLADNFSGLSGLLEDATGLGVLWYVLYRRGSFSDIGLRWSCDGAALAIPLFLCGILLSSFQRPAFLWLGRTFGTPGWQPPDVAAILYGTTGISISVVPDDILSGFHEELIVRAYLMTQVTKLTRRPWLAAIASVCIQTSYHFYQSVPIALSHIAFFGVFALFYARTNSILPVALAHSLFDLRIDWGYGIEKLFVR